MSELASLVPPEALKIALTLFLSFLIGLEREDHKAGVPHSFGGVRTFPLIGLLGYALSLLSGASFLPLTLGFGVVGGFIGDKIGVGGLEVGAPVAFGQLGRAAADDDALATLVEDLGAAGGEVAAVVAQLGVSQRF